VSGHVDSTCTVRAKRIVARDNYDYVLTLPEDLAPYVREKGSICLDGVSLTVKSAKGAIVEVTVVPFTLENTIIRNWRVGSIVNLEVDMMAKLLREERGLKRGE